MGVYREALVAEGKYMPSELPLFREVFCAKDKKTRSRWRPLPARQVPGLRDLGARQSHAQQSFDKDIDELVNDRFVLGSPEECYEQLRPYWEEFGVNHMVLRTHWVGMPLSHSRRACG